MKAIEMFCGIGGFRVALDELGIETVFANDINDNAAFVYKNNFSDKIFTQGDIKTLIHKIPSHDLLTAGFPCQPFSSAGKKLGISDPRGTLFESIVDVLKEQKPSFFILENVKRLISMDDGNHFATILKALNECGYFIEWRILNAFQFGLPQNRERIMITGIKTDQLLTKSSLIDKQENPSFSKDPLNTSNWLILTNHRKYFGKWGLCFNNSYFSCDINYTQFTKKRILKDIIQKKVDDSFDYTSSMSERLNASEKIDKYINGVEMLYNQRGGARMGYSVLGINGLAPTLTSSTSRHYERYEVFGKYRRLTNIEYARIQGFKDNHCDGINIYDQYQLFGNAVPPQMVKWAIQHLLADDKKEIKYTNPQMELIHE